MVRKKSYVNWNVYNKLDSEDKSSYLNSAYNTFRASSYGQQVTKLQATKRAGLAKQQKAIAGFNREKALLRNAYVKAQKQHDVGQGYKGLGKNELQSRINQAKYLHKKADKQASFYDNLYGQVVKSGYVDIFGDAKWAAKKYKSYKKVADQYDKQYSNLINKNKKLEY